MGKSVSLLILLTITGILDFWMIKNISGRFLVGMRWWTIIDDEGKEQYFFEKKKDF